jgi:tetratricopeptide (TPR) repeat protein
VAFADWQAGVDAYKASDFEQAVAEFRRFVDERPDQHAGHLMLGRSLFAAGRSDEAIEPFERALELRPDDATARLYLGLAFHESSKWRDCVAALNELDTEALPPTFQGRAYQLRSACHARLGGTRSAASDLGRVADLKPTDAKARFDYGQWLHHDGQIHAAIAAYERAISMAGSNPEWERTLADALVHAARTTEGHWARTGYYAKAEEVARGLVRASPNYDHLLLLGEAQLGGERYRPAASNLRRAIARDPADWRAYVALGQTFSHRGRHKRAEVSLRTALPLADGEDRNLVWNWLGLVLYRQGRYAEAAEAYHSAGNAEAAQEVREIQRRVEADRDDLEGLLEEAIRGWRGPLWLPGDAADGAGVAGGR